jgi:hypothetical protein
LQCKVADRDLRSWRIGCRFGLRGRIRRRTAPFGTGLGKEAGIEELESPQELRVLLMQRIRLVDRHGSLVFRPLGIRTVSLD